jgi:tetratricopeptide (TPR) repeat protein
LLQQAESPVDRIKLASEIEKNGISSYDISIELMKAYYYGSNDSTLYLKYKDKAYAQASNKANFYKEMLDLMYLSEEDYYSYSQKLYRLQPNEESASHYILAFVYMGQFQTADSLLNSIKFSNAKYNELIKSYFGACYFTKNYDKAMSIVHKFSLTNDITAMYDFLNTIDDISGSSYSDKNNVYDYKTEINLFSKYNQDFPSNPFYLIGLAYFAYRIDDISLTISYLDNAKNLGCNISLFYPYVAAWFVNNKEYNRAQKYFELYLNHQTSNRYKPIQRKIRSGFEGDFGIYGLAVKDEVYKKILNGSGKKDLLEAYSKWISFYQWMIENQFCLPTVKQWLAYIYYECGAQLGKGDLIIDACSTDPQVKSLFIAYLYYNSDDYKTAAEELVNCSDSLLTQQEYMYASHVLISLLNNKNTDKAAKFMVYSNYMDEVINDTSRYLKEYMIDDFIALVSKLPAKNNVPDFPKKKVDLVLKYFEIRNWIYLTKEEARKLNQLCLSLPQNNEIEYYIALFNAIIGNKEVALAKLAAWFPKSPFSPDKYCKYADVQSICGNYQTALKNYQVSISIDYNYYYLCRALDASYKLKDMVLAWDYLEKMLEIENSYINNIDKYPKILETKYKEIIDAMGYNSYIAILCYKLQLYEAAKYCFNKAKDNDEELDEFYDHIDYTTTIILYTPKTKPIISDEYPLVTNDGQVYLYFPETISNVSDGVLQVWTIAIDSYRDKKTPYPEVKALWQFNFNTKKIKQIQTIFYDKNSNPRTAEPDKEWSDVVPETIGETLFNIFFIKYKQLYSTIKK